MKVKVLTSIHSRITPGMIGTVQCTPEYLTLFPDIGVEVLFEQLPSPIPGNLDKQDAIYYLPAKDLQACKDESS